MKEKSGSAPGLVTDVQGTDFSRVFAQRKARLKGGKLNACDYSERWLSGVVGRKIQKLSCEFWAGPFVFVLEKDKSLCPVLLTHSVQPLL